MTTNLVRFRRFVSDVTKVVSGRRPNTDVVGRVGLLLQGFRIRLFEHAGAEHLRSFGGNASAFWILT